jgi:ribosomal protein S3AE
MSDTARDEFDFLGRQILKKSQTRALRKRMREFVDEHDGTEDLAALRRRAKGGEDLSDIVEAERDERI